jgi:formate hydrogenlyase transcriptional activator
MRAEQRAFPVVELSILRDVGRALSVATANALDNEEIRKLREQLEEENISLRAQLGQAPWFEEILAHSAALKRVLETIEQVATTDATVLITGEKGTGKELVARAIHRRSSRARGPFIKVNCAAIPDTLLASELFGHERGAFTGAMERRKGRFEQAHGGTLFLDEIGELPQEMQVLLLRVLQEREFERLGGTQTLRVDVRLVAATNRDLTEDVRTSRFRSDLYYRLNVAMTVRNFSRTFAREFGSTPVKFVTKLRVQTAQRLLVDSAKSLEEIAAECGFGSLDSMECAFRRETNRVPSSFRG